MLQGHPFLQYRRAEGPGGIPSLAPNPRGPNALTCSQQALCPGAWPPRVSCLPSSAWSLTPDHLLRLRAHVQKAGSKHGPRTSHAHCAFPQDWAAEASLDPSACQSPAHGLGTSLVQQTSRQNLHRCWQAHSVSLSSAGSQFRKCI